MLKIRVLGTGMIPRGLGLAPRLTPFPADKTLIATILAAKFKVEFVHPEKGIFIELTNKNFAQMYDKYAGYTVKNPPVEDSVPDQEPEDPKPDENPDPDSEPDNVDDEDSDADDDQDDDQDGDDEDGSNDQEVTSGAVTPKVAATTDETTVPDAQPAAPMAAKVSADGQDQIPATVQGGIQPKVSADGQQPVAKPQSVPGTPVSAKTTNHSSQNNGKNKPKKK